MRQAPHKKWQAGFTLLEVLVALVIFAFISVAASGVFTSLLRTQAALEEQDKRLDNLQRLLRFTRHDLSQTTWRAAAALPDPSTAYIQMTPSSLAVSTLGWPNPLQENRSTLSYVRYELTGGVLTRQVWPFTASELPVPALRQSLAEGAQSVRFELRTAPAADAAPGTPLLPNAIQVAVTLPSFGEVRQLIPLVKNP